VGVWDANGNLRIVDRKKNIFKLSQGEYVAAEKIENVYIKAELVAAAFVYGDSLHSMLVGVATVDPDALRRCMAEFTPQTGLVSSPPIGIRPDGFWARVECAFLNTYQARWQMAASRLGQGYAQGKMLFWDRRVLEAAGGIAVLGREMAEDVASTKVVRAQGKVVRLPAQFFEQPIGARKGSVVWSRQVRWAKVRRLGFLMLFLPELLAGAALPFVAVLALVGMGAPLWVLPAFLALWYGAEYLLAAAGDWPRAPADLAAWITRDALLPALWIAAWKGNSFEWRGNAMSATEVAKDKP
jgi:ceramide glucosyltransferase